MLAYTRRTDQDERFVLEGSWVEWVEVLFSVDKDVVLNLINKVCPDLLVCEVEHSI